MARPDVVIGTLERVDPHTDIEVQISGVDVKLTLRPASGEYLHPYRASPRVRRLI